MSESYTSKNIKTLKGIEAIRLRAGMYIGDTDKNGLHHLLLEVISNSIDECINGYGDKIEIAVNTKTNTAEVRDEGRGIPFGPMEDGKEALIEVVTNLHSGGKFEDKGYSVSGGLHGIGITAVNALSSKMRIESKREGSIARAEFSRGINKSLKVDKQKRNQKSGTSISFTPDKEIFGDTTFEYERIREQVRMLSFLTSGVAFELYFDNKQDTFYSEKGLRDLIEAKAKDQITETIYLREEANGFDVEVAFTFTKSRTQNIMAFTNNIPNPYGGTHVTGFKRATTTAFNKLAKQYGLLSEDESNLSGEMLRNGVVAVISIKMNESPVFQGQVKEKLASQSATGAVSSAITNNLESVLSRKDLEVIIEKALLERKAEEAAKRMREAAKKVVSGGRNLKMLTDLPEKLVDCNNPNGELYLVEGDSAGGSAIDGRDSKTQAVLPLRGKVMNTFNKELDEIIENKEIKDILTTLGCGIGDKFNIKNLRYSKIILLADADPDGQHINVLIMTLFLKHLPEIIQEGRLYRAVPPFYKVKKGKSTIYLQDDDAKEAYIKKHGQPKDITRFKGIGEMNSKELWDTTLDPDSRTLLQLTTNDVVETLEIFDILMGSSSKARKDFIMNYDRTGDENFGY